MKNTTEKKYKPTKVWNPFKNEYDYVTPHFTDDKPVEQELSDVKPFNHGQEGTHFSCSKMIEMMGGNVLCCQCVGHECDDNRVYNKINTAEPVSQEQRGSVEAILSHSKECIKARADLREGMRLTTDCIEPERIRVKSELLTVLTGMESLKEANINPHDGEKARFWLQTRNELRSQIRAELERIFNE